MCLGMMRTSLIVKRISVNDSLAHRTPEMLLGRFVFHTPTSLQTTPPLTLCLFNLFHTLHLCSTLSQASFPGWASMRSSVILCEYIYTVCAHVSSQVFVCYLELIPPLLPLCKQHLILESFSSPRIPLLSQHSAF